MIPGISLKYPSDRKEVSVKISNNDSATVLIQSWIDNSDKNARSSAIKVPFVLAPPMNHVDADKSQTLLISCTGTNLPMDKESVYWLNVLDVPGKNQAKAVICRWRSNITTNLTRTVLTKGNIGSRGNHQPKRN